MRGTAAVTKQELLGIKTTNTSIKPIMAEAEEEEEEEDNYLISEMLGDEDSEDREMETEGDGAEDEKALAALRPQPSLVAFSTVFYLYPFAPWALQMQRGWEDMAREGWEKEEKGGKISYKTPTGVNRARDIPDEFLGDKAILYPRSKKVKVKV